MVGRAGAEVLGVLPKCDRDRAVALDADVATDYRRIVELIDARRDLGCDEISFSKHQR
jgi:biopolymer transport protein ExbD